jgi:OOP family OmpA-OmpF porin
MKFHFAPFALSAALLAFAAPAGADVMGYASTARNEVWMSGTGLCWRTSAWAPDLAREPCDPVRRAEAPKPPAPMAVAPKPAPAPQPVAAPEPKRTPAPVVAMAAPKPAPKPAPVIQRVSLSADVLFEFDSARLRDTGKEKLRELAKSLRDAEVESLTAIGHADRIGADAYNRTLSEKRAQAVKEYLSELGIETKRIETAGAGATNPVTAQACQGLRGLPLIACLQPDRRVEVEVRGQRRVAGR